MSTTHGRLITRTEALPALAAETLDILVVGGGIVGAGIARDAAMRGLRVGLVEQHDFAFGTSSRSSRLLHGGLRYLAQGRIGLVHEASREKRVLHRIAPHLAAPLAFLFPTYDRGLRDPWAGWKLRIGVKAYDLLAGKNLGRSEHLRLEETLARLPGLNTQGLTGGVRYYDGLTNDARLVIDTLRSAHHAGAQLLNYVRFDGAERDGERWRCRLRDVVSGAELSITANTVVNAAGPWAQRVPHSRVQLRLTKGVHLVIDRARLPISDAAVMVEGERILFAIPWGERVILGTTDTDFDGPPECVCTDASDIEYILGVVNRAFPHAGIGFDEVISTWAGLRPLIADPSGKPSDISRSHEIRSPEPGWWDVAGGKLTTYRLMAEQTVDQVQQKLAGRMTKSVTADVPLLPPEDVLGVSALTPPPLSRDVVEHFCRREWAMHLDDVMVRRSSWRHYCTDASEMAVQVSHWMAGALGWSESQREEELRRYRTDAGPTAHANSQPPWGSLPQIESVGTDRRAGSTCA